MAMAETQAPPAPNHRTVGESLPLYTVCVAIGAMIPEIRPNVDNIPLADPLIGAGNASGVKAYSRALYNDWNQYSMALKLILAGIVSTTW